jgi:hypothetical protein
LEFGDVCIIDVYLSRILQGAPRRNAKATDRRLKAIDAPGGHGITGRHRKSRPREYTPMLAEKFFLILETLKSHAHPDGSTRVVSTSRHVPVKLPAGNGK